MSPLIVIAGTAHWGKRWLAEHHLAAALSRHVDVLFVDPPISAATAARNPRLASVWEQPRLRRALPRVTVLVPKVVPGKDRPGVRAIAELQLSRQVRWAIAKLGRQGATATIQTRPQATPLEGTVFGISVYWAKDDHEAGSHLYGLETGHLRSSEHRLIDTSDVFLTCSDGLAERWRIEGADPVVMYNGVDCSTFDTAVARPEPPDLPSHRPFAIFAGTLSPRIDVRCLEALAAREIPTVLLGAARTNPPWPGLDDVRNLGAVTLLGPRPYDELASYLSVAGVGIVPYAVDPYNQRSFPLKILEYLASGLPVVSTDLAVARGLQTDHIRIADTPDRFAAEVADLLDSAPGQHEAADRAAFAAQHDWSKRASFLLDLLGVSRMIQ